MWVCGCEDAGIHGAQKSKSDALEQESQAVVSHPVGMIGSKLRFPAKSLSALICCAISQGLGYLSYYSLCKCVSQLSFRSSFLCIFVGS